MEISKQQPNRLRRILIAAGVVGALVLAGCTYGSTMNRTPEIDRSAEQNVLAGTWDYMNGVTPNADSTLQVEATGQAILTFADDTQPGQTETSYIANPPINVYGTHVELGQAGGFAVSAELDAIDGDATLSLHSNPSIRFDERLDRMPGVDIRLSDSTATVTTYGQPGSKSKTENFGFTANGDSATIDIVQAGDDLLVTVNGTTKELNAKKAGVSFASSVWFGMDSKGSFNVSSLKAYPTKGSTLKLVDTSAVDYFSASRSSNGVASLAAANGRPDALIGTAVDLPVLMADPNYTKFIIENFNEIETEMLAKFQALQPEEGNFQFAELDALVDFAGKHGLAVHGHALIFGEAYPAWLEAKLASGDRAQAEALLKNHIQTVISRYDGQHGHGEIKYWDVVNEPFSADDMGMLSTYNLWYKALGQDYIKLAFQAASQANPNGVYGINENALEADDDRRAGMRQLVASVNADGKLIDFVGFQAHFDEDTLDDSDVMNEVYAGRVQQEFVYYANQGVDVRLSEVTVADNEKPDVKARVYGVLAEACATAPNCIGFNLWGAVNNTGLYFYNTATPADRDPGDDAPATQKNTEPVVEGAGFKAIRTSFSVK